MYKASSVFSPDHESQSLDELWRLISPQYNVDESPWLAQLLEIVNPPPAELAEITLNATHLIKQVRSSEDSVNLIDLMLLQYSLDTREGILLMCLAEALMRVPDAETADALIRDKISVAEWSKHLQQSDSFLVNASTWGLVLTGKVITLDQKEDNKPGHVIGRLARKLGEPVIRQAVNQAMKIMGEHFVLGRNIKEALKNGQKTREKGFTYSFDMLGEAAMTATDATKYHNAYLEAIKMVGEDKGAPQSPKPTISIKLSALCPRYDVANTNRVLTELHDSVLELIRHARPLGVGITIDAEEQDRLELSLKLFKKLYNHEECNGWGEFGLVVQAYGKRALPVLSWLNALAREQGDLIPIRLVKGAYWDSEIKLSQQSGYSGYPVYTRKEATDVAYLACAKFLLSDLAKGNLYPQFATHNAHTVASILTYSQQDEFNNSQFEFQRLHGMGDALYNTIIHQNARDIRIYAPVGNHKELLPYLVRRLLENSANSSFVHRLIDARTPVKDLVNHPALLLKSHSSLANKNIPLPCDIFGEQRLNSAGINLDIESEWLRFSKAVNAFSDKTWDNREVSANSADSANKDGPKNTPIAVHSPHRLSDIAGYFHYSDKNHIEKALKKAHQSFNSWNSLAVNRRGRRLERLANLLEKNKYELIALCHKEAGKTIHDSIDEIREAIDFCRYYAVQARDKLSASQLLTGPTGESNELYLTGRGVFVCISPWNFPLAIFIGQITAALAAGNTVIAKPAEQTSLIAIRAVELMLEAGIPKGAVQLVTGEGREVGKHLLSDPRIAGVAFTGSTETAKAINQTLAARQGAILPFIAETGGQNAMIVDSTALPEQIVADVALSAFSSAGQRCSALRVLYLQEDIADRVIELLKGTMAELKVGNPSLHQTDVGPIINGAAQKNLQSYIDHMKKNATLLFETPLSPDCQHGYFIAPVAFEIDSIRQLEKEQFGPILHVIRYKASELDQIIDDINSTGYGLTLGIHSRNESTAQHIDENVKAGNVYINRNQIGAVVGVQPFGGQGLSGTGPKAGGPHYLYRFTSERTRSVNTTAVGGNATLLTLGAKS